MTLSYTLPNVRRPFTNPKTGEIDRAWYLYLSNNFSSISNSNDANSITDQRSETGAQVFSIHKFHQRRTLKVALDFATGGVGTLADPWTGWIDSLNAVLAAGKMEVEFEEGYFASTTGLRALSPASAPVKLRGAGRDKSIFRYNPPSYNVLNFAVWIGDSTNNAAPAHGTMFPEIHGLSIHVGDKSSGGLRVRECVGGKFSDMFIRALPELLVGPGTAVNYYWGLMPEANLNTTYEDIDIDVGNGHQDDTMLTMCLYAEQSTQLDPNVGISGRSITTTRFNNVYLHHSADSAIIGTQIGCSFTDCIQESCSRGVTVRPGNGSLPVRFNNQYTENIIVGFPFYLKGISSNARASAIINGGTYSTPLKGTGTTAGDTFVYGTYIGTLKIKDFTVLDTLAQTSLVQSTNSEKIEMDACPISVTMQPVGGLTTSGGAITTTNTSPIFSLAYPGHGLVVGDCIGLQNFTTPYNGLTLNEPYFRVQAVTDANNVTLKSMLYPFSSSAASASGTQARNGSEVIVTYLANTWLNCLIQEPDRVKLADCLTQEILFSEALAGASGLASLLYQNAAGGGALALRGYVVDDWSYIMTAQGFTDADETGMTGTVRIDMPSGYEKDFVIANVPSTYTKLTYPVNNFRQTTVVNIGLKVPPGTVIRYKVNAPPVGNGVMQGRIVIARTGIK